MSAISDAAIKELAKKYLDFKYVALDSSDTAYNVTQTAPISELVDYGSARKMANASHNATTGVVTISTQFTFTGSVTVKAVCFLNALSGGVMLSRYVPTAGTLPANFETSGSLVIEATASFSRPA